MDRGMHFPSKLRCKGPLRRVCTTSLLTSRGRKTKTASTRGSQLRERQGRPSRPCLSSVNDRKEAATAGQLSVVEVDEAEWNRVRGLAEKSMFSACTALLYLIGFSFRLEGYMGYLLPLPIILMGVRHGAKSSWSTLALISILQIVLFGPVRAASFVCTHGFYSAVLATFWSGSKREAQGQQKKTWLGILLVTAAARAGGLIASIFVFSWVIGENILSLIFSGIENLVEQVFSVLGLPYLTFPLPRGLLAGTFCTLAILSSIFYVAVIYIMHSSVLFKMGYKVPLPKFLAKRLLKKRY